ncbi:MAG: RluA family pseudouridine synthase [Pseudomonadota bacterium]
MEKVTAKVHFIEVDENMENQRIDNFLCRYLHKVPKTHIYKIIRKGEVRVNKKRIKPVYKLVCGDRIRIPPVKTAEKTTHTPSSSLIDLIKNSILFENKQLLVVNKPSGLAVHGGSGINHGLIETLRYMYPEQSFLELVHRLDRDTSGCILIAKQRSALVSLHKQLRMRESDKRYLALCCGGWNSAEKVIDAPLLKNTLKSGERMVTVDVTGKACKSIFIPKQKFQNYCLFEVKIETGRTHQIRVHAQHIKHPIAGDNKYGSFACNQRLKTKKLNRLFLHASQITIDMDFSNTGKQTFKAALPENLQNVLNNLKDDAK